MSRTFIEFAGWYGACAIILAYVLVSFEIISADGYMYQLLNLSGALGIIVVSYTKKVLQSVFLNAVWATIAAAALVGLILKG